MPLHIHHTVQTNSRTGHHGDHHHNQYYHHDRHNHHDPHNYHDHDQYEDQPNQASTYDDYTKVFLFVDQKSSGLHRELQEAMPDQFQAASL